MAIDSETDSQTSIYLPRQLYKYFNVSVIYISTMILTLRPNRSIVRLQQQPTSMLSRSKKMYAPWTVIVNSGMNGIAFEHHSHGGIILEQQITKVLSNSNQVAMI